MTPPLGRSAGAVQELVAELGHMVSAQLPMRSSFDLREFRGVLNVWLILAQPWQAAARAKAQDNADIFALFVPLTEHPSLRDLAHNRADVYREAVASALLEALELLADPDVLGLLSRAGGAGLVRDHGTPYAPLPQTVAAVQRVWQLVLDCGPKSTYVARRIPELKKVLGLSPTWAPVLDLSKQG